MKKFIFFLLSLASLFSLQASHFMGASMSYQCLGGCNYRIYQTTYLDCGGAAMGSYIPITNTNPYLAPTISAVGNAGCTVSPITGNWQLLNCQDITPVCASQPNGCNTVGANINGVSEAVYYIDYNLCDPGCTSVTFSWSNCCRNYNLSSSVGAGIGIYTDMKIDLVNNACNSSPYFYFAPPTYIAAGQSTTIPQKAYDIDGDSLVYSLDTCWASAGTAVTYNAGYSSTSPLGAGWAISIDAATGDLSFIPVAPLNGPIVAGVIGIKVSEYRNGVWIGNTKRDIELVAIGGLTTPNNALPTYTITSLTGAYLSNTNELLVNANATCSFDITAIDTTTQFLNFSSYLNQVFPNASITGFANTNPLQLHVSFTPTNNQAGYTYPIIIDIFDDNCALNGHTPCFYSIKVNPFDVLTTINPAACGLASGSISLSPQGGTPPYAYSWSTGDTSQNISNLLPGAYSVVVTDSFNAAYNSGLLYVTAGNLLTTFTLNSPDCNMANGSIIPNTTNGTAPYSYTWNTGQVVDSLTGLATGGYSVNITDAAGCFEHEVQLLNYDPADSCFSRIEGTLYYDSNNNCVQDSWEVGLPNMLVDLTPGGAMLTDANGHYSFVVADTGTYTSTCIPNNYVYNGISPASCDSTFTHAVYIPLLGIDSLAVDFPLHYFPDIAVSLWDGNYSLANVVHHAYIHCYNHSFYLSNATVSYQHSPTFQNLTFIPPATTYNAATHTATWNLTNFTVGTLVWIHVWGNIDSTATVGDSVISYANIIPLVGDAHPQNNQDTVTRFVVASYDPNYKEVFPQGETNYGLIPQATPKLEYVLNFQNTGNYPAQVVILRDTIDNDLDITSIDMQISSHPCTITIENDEILVFTFNNINLPDSTTDEPNSHGFVKFGMNLKPNLPLDTQIDNSVAIYFDYNAPVITNSVKNTLYNPMQLVMADTFTLCPTDLLTLTVQDGKAPYTFSWDNGTAVSGNTTGVCTIPANFLNGMHTVHVSDFYGAIRTHTFNFSTVLPFADASFSSSSTGNTVAFSANVQGLASYAWDFGNGQTSTQASANITYTNAGTYPVSLIVTDNCGRKDTMTTEINVTVSIADAEFTQHIRLFPNPFSQFTTLSFDNPDNSPYELSIFDLSGKLVQKISNIRSNEVKISMENKAKGSYLWELKGKSVASGVMDLQ